jgi:hypothetical protein
MIAKLPARTYRSTFLNGGSLALLCFLGQFNSDDPQPTASLLLNVDLTG